MATAGIDDEATGRIARRRRGCVGPESVVAAAPGHHARRTRDPRSSPPGRLTRLNRRGAFRSVSTEEGPVTTESPERTGWLWKRITSDPHGAGLRGAGGELVVVGIVHTDEGEAVWRSHRHLVGTS